MNCRLNVPNVALYQTQLIPVNTLIEKLRRFTRSLDLYEISLRPFSSYLSYQALILVLSFSLSILVDPDRFELSTYRLKAGCSSQLSYGSTYSLSTSPEGFRFDFIIFSSCLWHAVTVSNRVGTGLESDRLPQSTTY